MQWDLSEVLLGAHGCLNHTGDGAPYIHRDMMQRVFTQGDGDPYIHRDKMLHVFTQGDGDPCYTACECQLFADCGRIACVPTLWVKRRLVELTTTKTTKTTKTKGMLLHVVPVVVKNYGRKAWRREVGSTSWCCPLWDVLMLYALPNTERRLRYAISSSPHSSPRGRSVQPACTCTSTGSS